MPRIPKSLNVRLPLSPDKPPSILIEGKMHRLPIFQSSAAVDLAVGLRLDLSQDEGSKEEGSKMHDITME